MLIWLSYWRCVLNLRVKSTPYELQFRFQCAVVRTDANVTPGGAGAHQQFQPGNNNDYPPAVFPEAGAAGGQRQEENLNTGMLR